MIRRDFLTRLVAGAAVPALLRGAEPPYAAAHRRAVSTAAKLNRIAVSTWSLHNYFRSTRRSDCTLPGPMLALLDFPEMMLARYKVRHFEFCSTHFASTEPAYLHELRYMLVRTRGTVVNIPVDIPECGRKGTFSDPDPDKRAAALNAVKRWVDIARAVGARSVRVGPGKVDPGNLARTAAAYRALATYAQARGVHVVVENHGGFATDDPQELLKLFKLAGPGRIGALPDFANFPDEPTRERGLRLLFPYAQAVCHAKGLEFDADGAEEEYDFPRAMAIAKLARFRGTYSIEFDGPGDPYAGIQKTLDELLKYV